MSLDERFERIVAIVPSLMIAVVIALALVQLHIRIVPLLVSGAIAFGAARGPLRGPDTLQERNAK